MMNANPVRKKLEAVLKDPNYIAEIKWDGCRYEYCESDLVSKLGNSKGANAPHLIEVLSKYDVNTDGEVYYPGKDSNATTSIMGSLPGTALAKQMEIGNIRYMLYDIMNYKGKEIITSPWKYRRECLEDFYGWLSDEEKEFIDLSEVYPDKFGLRNLEEVMKFIKIRKIEGLMFKNIQSAYYPGLQPENVWFKIKTEVTFEAIITGYIPGTGKYSGQIGSMIFSLYDDDGKLVECGKASGFSDKIRMEVSLAKNDYLGRVIEVHAFNQITRTSFRHPTFFAFRDDKDPKRCDMHQLDL